jgi:hypothetical protein
VFDTTSTYFEISAEREDDFRVFGNSKDHLDGKFLLSSSDDDLTADQTQFGE